MTEKSDIFTLYDLRVEIIKGSKSFVCSHREGDYFEVKGENIIMPSDQPFSMYSLAALLPLLPAKQRETDPNDWMTTDHDVACPDPNCGALFRITRVKKSQFNHSDVTIVPLRKENNI